MKKANPALEQALAKKREKAEERLYEQMCRLQSLVRFEAKQMRALMHEKFGPSVGVSSELAIGSVEIIVDAWVNLMVAERRELAHKQKNGILA